MKDFQTLRPADPNLEALLSDFPTCVRPSENPVMDEEEVVRIIQLAEIAGIPLVVDGGWGVDALLGWQTREHVDLDLVINQQYLGRLLNILRRLDYQYLPRLDEWEHNFVLENGAGHQIDIHSFVRNSKGQIVGGVEYPGDSLNGQGRIGGVNVACIQTDWQLDFHLGYDFDHQDYEAVNYLCNLGRIQLPPEYRDYANALYLGEPTGQWHLPENIKVRLTHTAAEYLAFSNILDKSQRENLPPISEDIFSDLLTKYRDPESLSLADLRDFGLRTGLVLLEDENVIGACEVIFETSEGDNGEIWLIRQISLAKRADYSSLFMALLRSMVQEALRVGAGRLEALPIDDILQPRKALPERYDAGEIGYASFFARAGFRRLEAIPGSRWGFVKKQL